MDIEIRAEAVMEGRDYLALTRFMTNGKNKNSIMMNILLLLIAIVGVYADFKVNEKPTIITIVAVIAVLGAFLLPELSARRFIKKDQSFIGHTMRYVFNDNGINVLDEQNGTTALPLCFIMSKNFSSMRAFRSPIRALPACCSSSSAEVTES